MFHLPITSVTIILLIVNITALTSRTGIQGLCLCYPGYDTKNCCNNRGRIYVRCRCLYPRLPVKLSWGSAPAVSAHGSCSLAPPWHAAASSQRYLLSSILNTAVRESAIFMACGASSAKHAFYLIHQLQVLYPVTVGWRTSARLIRVPGRGLACLLAAGPGGSSAGDGGMAGFAGARTRRCRCCHVTALLDTRCAPAGFRATEGNLMSELEAFHWDEHK